MGSLFAADACDCARFQPPVACRGQSPVTHPEQLNH